MRLQAAVVPPLASSDGGIKASEARRLKELEQENARLKKLLSCCSFDANQARLQLHVLAYNLANFLRRLALPARVKHRSLTTLREKLIKVGAKVVQHARYVRFQVAEVAIPRPLFAAILRRIKRLRLLPPRALAPP